MKYSEHVEKYSNENNVDIYMIYAIIKVESNFNTNVKSQSNAIGLMHLLKETATDCLVTAVDFYIEDHRLFPAPSKTKKDNI